MSTSAREKIYLQEEIPAIHGDPEDLSVGKSGAYVLGGIFAGVIAGVLVREAFERKDEKKNAFQEDTDSTAVAGAAVGAGALLGLLTGLVIRSGDRNLGKNLAADLGLDDPIFAIKRGLINQIQAESDRITLRDVHELQPIDFPGEIRQRFPDTLLMDFKTLRWKILDGRLSYSARARVTDTGRRRTLWSAFCRFYEEPSARTKTVEDLKKDGGKLLKERISRAVDYCVDQLVLQFQEAPVEK